MREFLDQQVVNFVLIVQCMGGINDEVILYGGLNGEVLLYGGHNGEVLLYGGHNGA